jgi:hypothetical protein
MKIANLCFSLLLATIPSVSGNARDTVDVSDRTYIVVFSDTVRLFEGPQPFKKRVFALRCSFKGPPI